MNMHNPPHPGEILREWLTEVTVTHAAESLGVTRAMLSRILNGASAISADMDVRLSRALGTSPGYWLGLQADYDLQQAQKRFKSRVRRIAIPNMSRVA
jgi:antitoxin HigA-1